MQRRRSSRGTIARSAAARRSKVEQRPPASSTSSCTARSPRSASLGSAATSTAPSATRQCCQKSPKPRLTQARRASSRPAGRHLVPLGGRDDAVLDPVDRRDADRLAVRRERALAARGPPAAAERGRRDDRGVEPALALEREQRRPDRDAAHVVPRAVDRVDDPADVAAVVAELLAEHALAGPPRRDERRGSPPRPPGRPR